MSLFPLKAIALNVVYIPAVKHAPVTFYLREKHIHLYTESHLEGEILLFFQATAHVIRSATFCLFFGWVFHVKQGNLIGRLKEPPPS